MGTVHSLAEARRKKYRPGHEIKKLDESWAIVTQYFDTYLETVKELADAKVVLEKHKQKVKGWKGWFRSFFLKTTTNRLQFVVDTIEYRKKFQYNEFQRAKQSFEEIKAKIDRRLASLDIYRTTVIRPEE